MTIPSVCRHMQVNYSRIAYADNDPFEDYQKCLLMANYGTLLGVISNSDCPFLAQSFEFIGAITDRRENIFGIGTASARR